MEWLDRLTAAILNLIAHREVAAVVLGFLISLGATQLIKQYFTDALTRNRVNLLAIMLGSAAAIAIFPAEHGWALRACFGAAVGLLSPVVYKTGMWLIERQWPGFAQRASGDL